jgi:hypothetical protein
MARKFLVPIDLTKQELQNARIQNLASAPSSPVSGQIYYDTTTNALYIYNGTAWTQAGGITYGTLSARPVASAVSAGTLYYATDNYLIYFSNGSTWQQSHDFGSVTAQTSFAQTSSSGTATTYSHSDHTHGTPTFTPSSYTLDQFGAPAANVSFNSKKITNLLDPTSAQDAATKNYVDSAVQGLNIHDNAQVATTANLTATYAAGTTGADGGTGVGATLTITATGALVIDGYTTVLNDRILVKNQTTATQNGIYTVTTVGASGVSAILTRSTDADNHIAGQVVAGDFIFVAGGTTQGSTGWVETAQGTATTPPKGIKIGTDNIAFSQFSGAGTYSAGNGLTLTGTTFAVDSTKIPSKYAATIGDGTNTSYTVTHSLSTRDVQVTVYDASTYGEVSVDITHTTTSAVTIVFSVAPASNAYRVVVMG